jgi:putative ubiquitin-RnfH superfamily antitoxin RatB of RatAB toxin-antitoxin module
LKRCTLACDTSRGILLCELELPNEANIESALNAAKEQLSTAEVDWQRAATGVYGKVVGRRHVWADGDRIEVYRPLELDPRARRRQRAAKSSETGR